MKAITLWQPWASLVACGLKSIETRSWSTKYRGPLAIHAAKKEWDDQPGVALAQALFEPDQPGVWRNPSDPPIPRGAVVATCYLAEVVPTDELTWSRGLAFWWVKMDGDPLRVVRTEVSSGQRPYGDYGPGRFAWLLANVKPLAVPVPARGRQGLWNWEESCT